MNTSQEKKLKVYKSSAGSGKTFTLVKEFLKLCLSTNSAYTFSSILAITFTNKATYEMKNRILDALEELSNLNEEETPTVLANLLIKEIGLSKKEIQERSEKTLRSILHNYADFNVSTIDRFSHRLIRTFAKDLGLSMGFQVSLDEKDLLQDVIASLIDAIGEDEKLSNLLLDFAMYKIEEEKSWNIENDLLDFSYKLLNDSAEPYLQELRKCKSDDFRQLKEQYTKANKIFENQIQSPAREAINLIINKGIEDQSFAGRSKISIYFKKISKFEIDSIRPSPSLTKDIESDKWHSTKCIAEQKVRIDGIKEQLLKYFNEIQQIIEKDLKDYLSRSEIIKNLHNLTLLNEIEKSFTLLKKEEKLLNISDFNKLLAQVVLNEPIPFIYERLGERFQHLMIDEFQDTSILQYMNIMPLIEDSLARGKENLIVGDAKQAIYRFRGGEVEQFAEMPNYIPQIASENPIVQMRLETLRSQYQADELQVNYRSSEAVVNFNNDFFHFIKEEIPITPKIKSIFEGHHQKIASDKSSGFVSISFSSEKKEAFNEIMKQLVLEDIRNSLSDGYRLKDIAILLRKKKDAVTIATYLTENGVEVISSEALLLSSSLEVAFLINMSKWMFDKGNQLFQKEIIEYFYTTDQLKGSLDENFRHYLVNNQSFKKVFEQTNVTLDTQWLNQLPVNELFESLIRIFGMDQSYNPYLQGLQDEAFDFSNSQSCSIQRFLEWWDENYTNLSIETPEDFNAITILTIHKSKGLEFPVVIYPFARQKVEHSGSRKKNFLWVPTLQTPKSRVPYALVEFNSKLSESSHYKFYQEELTKKEVDLINDTYVAFTRAAERMYVHSEVPPESPKLLNLSSILMAFINYKGLKADENEQFTFGNRDQVIKVDGSEKNNFEIEYISNPWRSKLKIANDTEKLWGDTNEASQKKYGTFLHHLMAKIITKEDLKTAIDASILAGEINYTEAKELSQKIISLLQMPEVSPYFGENLKVKNEATLINDNGDLLRPDRVIFGEDVVTVIDYKTGDQNEAHFEQLDAYVSTISKTTELPVKGYLLYTEIEELIEL